MATPIARELAIHVNGYEAVSGDALSIQIIWNNLTGKNFEDATSWKVMDYPGYLKQVGRLWGVAFEPGTRITLRRSAVSQALDEFTFQA